MFQAVAGCRTRPRFTYQRGDILAKRAAMMGQWATYLMTPPKAATVQPLRRKAAA
jgi:hypothetical protein